MTNRFNLTTRVVMFACGATFAGAVAAPASPEPAPNRMAAGGNSPGYDMAPETRLEVVEAAVAQIPATLPSGPFEPTWASLKSNYKVPDWFYRAKFGLFMHWGLYAVPAHHNEWYEKHMYGPMLDWHTEHFGAPDTFGYKDFIPLFTADKFDASAWAGLFEKSGARFVVPTAQHHDNFALWDSAVTPFNAKAMGPHRDLIGELAQAVRARGLKFGVSNHGIENFQFINPSPELAADLKAKQADLYDPKWADFYNVADRSDAAAERFLVDWFERNVELIEKYRPDMLWFDNGVDQRYLDPLKLQIAAYYYNRAAEWGQAVSISTKKAAYAPGGNNLETIGSIIDFEKIGTRSPSGIRPGAWQVDHPIGSTWGYTSDMTVSDPADIIEALADTVSKNGTLLLNLSPKADGTIPPEQQATLLGVGDWLRVNGEAIYGTHNWIRFQDRDDPDSQGPEVRYTVKGEALYAIVIHPANETAATLTLAALAAGGAVEGEVTRVTLLGGEALAFTRDAGGLRATLPARALRTLPFTLKIEGLRMNSPVNPADGNPPQS